MKYLTSLAFLLTISLCAYAQKDSATIAIGAQPTFAVLAMDGSRVDMAALRGKVVVINLWFVNCPNCVEEITLLNKLVDDNASNKDVVFLGLAASSKPALDKFLAKNPFKYTVVPGAQMIILGKFGVPDRKGEIDIPFPMHFVLDRTGKVVMKEQGVKGVNAVRAELAKQLGKPTGSN